MNRNRFWIEIIVLGSAGAFVLALVLATLGLAVSAVGQQAVASTTAKTYQGIVTCSLCGAKHSSKHIRSAAECTVMCVRSGGNFTLVDGDTTYQLEGDLNLLKKLAGTRVELKGTARGNTINVSSVAGAS